MTVFVASILLVAVVIVAFCGWIICFFPCMSDRTYGEKEVRYIWDGDKKERTIHIQKTNRIYIKCPHDLVDVFRKLDWTVSRYESYGVKMPLALEPVLKSFLIGVPIENISDLKRKIPFFRTRRILSLVFDGPYFIAGEFLSYNQMIVSTITGWFSRIWTY